MKKWVRHTSIATTLALGVSALVAGCGNASSSTNTSTATNTTSVGSASTAKPVTLTIMSWNVAMQTLQKDATLYHKLHPNVTFKFDVIDNPTDAYTKLNAELASGSGVPDIMSIESEPAQSFLTKFPNSFLNVTSAVSSLKPKFAPSKWPDLTMNGKIYGVPWDIGPTLLFYRADLFKQAGINPASIKTWADYIAAGKKLVKHFHGKVKMIPAGVGDDALVKMMVSQEGAGYFNKSGNITINSPAAVKAVTTEEQMVKAGIVDELPKATDWNDSIKAFTTGQVASVPFGIWYVGTLETSAPSQKGKWRAMVMPAFTPNGNHAANSGGSNLLISAKTANPQVATDFAKFAMTNTKALDAGMNLGLFPSYKPYYTNPLITSGLPFFGGQKVFELASKEVNSIPTSYHTSDFTSAATDIQTAIGNVMASNANPQSALNQAAQQLAQATNRKIAK